MKARVIDLYKLINLKLIEFNFLSTPVRIDRNKLIKLKIKKKN